MRPRGPPAPPRAGTPRHPPRGGTWRPGGCAPTVGPSVGPLRLPGAVGRPLGWLHIGSAAGQHAGLYGLCTVGRPCGLPAGLWAVARSVGQASHRSGRRPKTPVRPAGSRPCSRSSPKSPVRPATRKRTVQQKYGGGGLGEMKCGQWTPDFSAKRAIPVFVTRVATNIAFPSTRPQKETCLAS